MRLGRLLTPLLIALLFLPAPVSSKFGVVKTRARFAMYHPPAFYAPARQLKLSVDSVDMRTGLMLASRLQHFLEEGLMRENFKLTPSAPTLLQCTLTDATASLDTTTRSESVNVHVGEHTEKDKKGKTKRVEDCKFRTVPVTYLLSSGHVAMDVKALDTETQGVLMSQLVEHAYRQESPIGGPPKCGGESYGVQHGQLQDPLAILGLLGDQAVNDTLGLAAGFDETREVLLAVDDELKPGNAQASAGNWQAALDTWTSVAVRSSAAEAARQYNLGVAHEALAAAGMHSGELDAAASHLSQAQECYAQALQLDPDEKYFRDTLTRTEGDRQLLQQEMEQASAEDAANAGAAPCRPAPAAAPLAIPLEGWPPGEPNTTHDYRVYVRTRLSALPGQPADALKQELLAAAGDYSVKPDEAQRVLDSETQRLAVMQRNLDQYREDFQAAAADGLITSEKRQMLRKRQQILHLSDAQVKAIEAKFGFQEAN